MFARNTVVLQVNTSVCGLFDLLGTFHKLEVQVWDKHQCTSTQPKSQDDDSWQRRLNS